MDKPTETLINNVKKILSGRGMNISDLAKETGIAKPNLYNILNGKNRPNLGTVERLSEALGLSPSDLLNDGPTQLHPDSRYESLPKDVLEGLLALKDNETALNAVRMIIKANALPEKNSKSRA